MLSAGGCGHIRRSVSSELCRHRLSRIISTPLQLFFFTTTAAADQGAETAAAARPGPPPIQVALTESAGRGVFATRRIQVGELIHSAEPLLTYPSSALIGKVCHYCLRRLGIGDNGSLLCFCSESCRERSKVYYDVESKADWSLFDERCRERGLKYPFMVKRLACMVISGAVSAECIDILQPASLHPNMLLEMEEEFQLLKHAFVEEQLEDEKLKFLTKQWYVDVLARIRINAFRVELVAASFDELLTSASLLVSADAAVGNAIYMLPSFYNHDCDPNTHIVWIGNANAKLKALRDIEAGEELQICYIDTSMGYEARQKILAEGFGFKCQCPRCLSQD